MTKNKCAFYYVWLMIQGIYPYLQERAWSRKRANALVDSILKKRAPLSDEETNTLLDILLIENNIIDWELADIVPTETIQEESDLIVSLKCLSDVQGVNALCLGGEITFWKNLTVIYGSNWSWKTGYCRILKSLAPYTHDSDKQVLQNVLSWTTVNQCATIKYELDWTERILNWTNSLADTLPLAIFNNSCVSYSLWQDRSLLAQPDWFYLFDLIGWEIEKLKSKLNGKLTELNTAIPLTSGLHEWTEIYKFHETLNKDTKDEEIDKMAGDKTQSEIESEIILKKWQLEGLNNELLSQKITQYWKQLEEINAIIVNINNISTVIIKKKREDFVNNKNVLKEISTKQQCGISELATSFWASLTETPEFMNLIVAADSYISLLEDYPRIDKNCIYCLQPLNEVATTRLLQYKSTLEQARIAGITLLETQIQEYRLELNNLNTVITLAHGAFWTIIEDWNETSVIPDILSSAFGEFARYKNELSDEYVEIDFQWLIYFLDKEHQRILKEKNELETQRISLDKIKWLLELEIAKLIDCKQYIQYKPDILTYINNLKTADKIQNTLRTDLSKGSLSAKKASAKNHILTENYHNLYKKERNDLHCPDFVGYTLWITEWDTSLRQNIHGYSLNEILSDWEQKSIALAQFITEIKVANLQIPLIFDDPVTSLDEERRQRIAQKLFELSLTHQVIIFTHDLIIFYELEQLHESLTKQRPKVEFEYHYYTVNRCNNEPWNTNPSSRPSQEKRWDKKGKLNQIIHNRPSGYSDEEVISKWYAILREIIEILIENDILRWIVRRHKRHIPVEIINEIDLSKVNTHRDCLLNVYRRCCVFLEWHSHPDWTRIIPTLDELKSDRDSIQGIHQDFNV